MSGFLRCWRRRGGGCRSKSRRKGGRRRRRGDGRRRCGRNERWRRRGGGSRRRYWTLRRIVAQRRRSWSRPRCRRGRWLRRRRRCGRRFPDRRCRWFHRGRSGRLHGLRRRRRRRPFLFLRHPPEVASAPGESDEEKESDEPAAPAAAGRATAARRRRRPGRAWPALFSVPALRDSFASLARCRLYYLFLTRRRPQFLGPALTLRSSCFLLRPGQLPELRQLLVVFVIGRPRLWGRGRHRKRRMARSAAAQVRVVAGPLAVGAAGPQASRRIQIGALGLHLAMALADMADGAVYDADGVVIPPVRQQVLAAEHHSARDRAPTAQRQGRADLAEAHRLPPALQLLAAGLAGVVSVQPPEGLGETLTALIARNEAATKTVACHESYGTPLGGHCGPREEPPCDMNSELGTTRVLQADKGACGP